MDEFAQWLEQAYREAHTLHQLCPSPASFNWKASLWRVMAKWDVLFGGDITTRFYLENSMGGITPLYTSDTLPEHWKPIMSRKADEPK
jgi:hypothetical protein